MAIKKGFAAMDPTRLAALASRAGKAAHAMGHAHTFTSGEARAAGKKGGEAVARRPGHMASIGRKGGATVARNSEHMKEIARLGGIARAKSRAGS